MAAKPRTIAARIPPAVVVIGFHFIARTLAHTTGSVEGHFRNEAIAAQLQIGSAIDNDERCDFDT